MALQRLSREMQETQRAGLRGLQECEEVLEVVWRHEEEAVEAMGSIGG